jgi:hypothetical protein
MFTTSDPRRPVVATWKALRMHSGMRSGRGTHSSSRGVLRQSLAFLGWIGNTGSKGLMETKPLWEGVGGQDRTPYGTGHTHIPT